MTENGLGFQLALWSKSLGDKLGQHVSVQARTIFRSTILMDIVHAILSRGTK